MSHELVDRKFGVESLLVPYLAFLQIDRHLVIVDLLRSRHESRHLLFAQSNRKETILRAIVRKNVCERRRNYRPEAQVMAFLTQRRNRDHDGTNANYNYEYPLCAT